MGYLAYLILRSFFVDGSAMEEKGVSVVHIFHFASLPPAPGEAKIWLFGWLGKKYDDLLGKKAKGVLKREKRGNSHHTWGKKYNFGKKGGGAKISNFWEKYTPGGYRPCH